jgi:hypothetical protein
MAAPRPQIRAGAPDGRPRGAVLARAAAARASAAMGDLARRSRRIAFTLEHETLVGQRVRHAVPVCEPLVLVSQIQRSGGTLLSQLFDAHPELHAHPHELHVGNPSKVNWPELDLAAGPDEWFRILFEHPTGRAFEEGYNKAADRSAGAIEPDDILPFLIPPTLQRELFEAALAARPARSQRDVFDAYMTSYFNAWLDNHNLYAPGKRWVTAFTARLSSHPVSVARFFAAYPDGRLVSVVRDPRSWWASAKRFREVAPWKVTRHRDYSEVETAIGLWRGSAEAMLEAYEQRAESFRLLRFDALLGDTEATMRSLAEWLGISFHPTLVEPTFNGLPIKADSSFAVADHGVHAEPLERFREVLPPEEIAFVEERAMPLYERVAALAG